MTRCTEFFASWSDRELCNYILESLEEIFNEQKLFSDFLCSREIIKIIVIKVTK